jgi:hypothetical protein
MQQGLAHETKKRTPLAGSGRPFSVEYAWKCLLAIRFQAYFQQLKSRQVKFLSKGTSRFLRPLLLRGYFYWSLARMSC